MIRFTVPAVLLLFHASACFAQGLLDVEWEKISHPQSTTLKGKPQDPPSADEMQNTKSLIFIMGVGSGLYGYDAIRISDDGSGLMMFVKYEQKRVGNKMLPSPTWWLASFKLSKEDVLYLRSSIADNKGLMSRDAYHADLCDGTQAFVKLKLDGRPTSVYCNNHFPATLRRLHEAIKSRFGETLRAATKEARQLTNEERDKPEFAELRHEHWVER